MHDVPHPYLTNTLLMVTADSFGYDTETAETNSFQVRPVSNEQANLGIRGEAIHQFWDSVETIRAHGITVAILPTRTDVVTPSAVFPNNWFSHHRDLGVILYPMLTRSRRQEIQLQPLLAVLAKVGVTSQEVIDLTGFEHEGLALEGTGSLVLDRAQRLAFVAESLRSNRQVLAAWCEKTGYQAHFFHSYDQTGQCVYHTNVVMSVGERFAVVCLESVTDDHERAILASKLEELGKCIIPISRDQMGDFCGNILQVQSRQGTSKIVLSRTAFDAFTSEQQERLESHGDFVVLDISVIERYGGGSARCMLAEVFPAE